MPNTVSVSDIQKKYRQIFDAVKKTKEPVIVLSGNKPDVAILDYGYLEDLREKAYKIELEDAFDAIAKGEEELKMGKTKKAKSLAQFLNENK